MRKWISVIKLDSICKDCRFSVEYDHHRCMYTAIKGDYFTSAKSGRIGLAKDGLSCIYFKLRQQTK